MNDIKGQANASISYGKDSLAMLEVIHRHNLPLDRIIHAEVWATPTLPADLPEMVEFKQKADEIILKRYGIKVERIRAKKSFEEIFYTVKKKGENAGTIYGWPRFVGMWCNNRLKTDMLDKELKNASAMYVGVALDEPTRVARLRPPKASPLAQFGYTEKDCYEICEELDLLAPSYTSHLDRGGCWFCPKQKTRTLRVLRAEYPELWQKILEWDNAWQENGMSHIPFRPDYTVSELEEKFDNEDRQIKLF